MSDWEFHIEPLGQQAGLWNLYTQLTFCYSLPNDIAQTRILDTLRQGLRRLADGFPWVAGQVSKECRDGDNGKFDYWVVRPFEPAPQYTAQDLSSKLPTMKACIEARFPIAYLDENTIAPRNTKSIATEKDPKPVFLLQVTFIVGGVLLTFAGQHGTLDLVGLAGVIRLLSKACHDEPFTQDEIELGNQDRRGMVPLLDRADIPRPDEMPLSHSAGGAARNTPQATAIQPSTNNTWAYFDFSLTSLQTLKSSTTESVILESGFISTDDAISAFIWQSIMRAREPRLLPTDSTTFARTVDVRHYFGIPSQYPGNLATKTFTTFTVHDILVQPLGAIASQLRLSIDDKASDLSRQVRMAVTALARGRSPDQRRNARDLSKDIAFSSWAKAGYCHHLDFNLGLGSPVAVRRPSFAPPNEQPMEGVVYLMPKGPDGSIAVAICLQEGDMSRLKIDGEWLKFAVYIG